MEKALKKFALLSFLIMLGLTSLSQDKTAAGKVVDPAGLPVSKATILVKGTNTGTSTNEMGMFSLTVPSSAKTIVVSSVGFETKEVSIALGMMNIALEPSSSKLDEVVVVGYGVQKVTKVSGAVSTVKGSDIEKLKPVRAEDALQGRASGVTVVSNGSPGAKPTVLVRGIPSYTGTDPVVVVDGAIQTLDDFNAINPADIESVNVLKDAATTAIYGVKGGNGVIVVTTKTGRKNQKTEITYSGNYAMQEVLNQIGVLNASEYAAIVNEGSVTSGGSLVFPNLSGLGAGTNWQDQIFKQAPLQSHTVAARGGSDKMAYFLSGGYLSQAGIVGGGEKSYFNRINATSNLSFDLSSKLKFITNTTYTNIKGAGVPENAINSVISNALNFDPTVPVLNNVPNTYGKYSTSKYILSEIINPLTQLEDTYNKNNTSKLYGKLELQYDLLKNLKLSSRFGYTNTDVTGKNFTPLSFYGTSHINSTMNADGTAKPGSHNNVYEYKTNYFNYTFENFANYNFKVGQSHNFETVAGFSMARVTGNSLNGSRQDVPFNSWSFADISSATGIATLSGIDLGSYQYERRNLSYFGRVDYDFNEKYLVSGTLRRDGSFAFGDNNKFANFFSGSLGWVVTQEDFFKVGFIDYLKIRGSYGVTGNENVNPQYQRISTLLYAYGLGQNAGYSFGNEPTSVGATIASFKNDDLKWEEQAQLNAGFDIRFFNNKFSFSGDYFRKDISGLLFTPTLSLYLGTASLPTANIGTTRTSGVDMNLGYTDQLSKNFRISTNVTFTTATNLVTETNNGLITGGGYGIPYQSVTRFEKDKSPGYFYGFKTDGLFQTQADVAKHASQPGAQAGDIRFVDINGDGKIDGDDRTDIGNPFPEFTIGWNLSLEYKGFDFNSFVYASVGNEVYRAYERNLAMTNKFRSVLGRWTGSGSTNESNNPRYSFIDANNNTRVSDRYVEDGSFIKIKNLQLGYNFSSAALRRANISKLRIYAQARNAFTFTKYTGFDPEISGGIFDTGIDRGAYPQARSFAIGLDLKF
ncbi:MAG: TonB-dependent receptor [Chitinophagaceae bacterium]|nr:TonB-dependent receptor [Chitinophagaceae bacterium]